MDDLRRKMLEDMMSDMTLEDFRQIDGTIQTFVRDMAERSDTPIRDQGTAKDTAVQRLAAWAISWHRDPNFRKRENRRYDPDEQVSYDKIAEVARVSRARVHMLFQTLVPHLYEEQTQKRRTG